MTDKVIKEQLVHTIMDLYRAGLITEKGGNISVRSIERKNAVYITPTRINKGTLQAEQLILIDMDGRKIEGRNRPSIECKYHAGIMKARPKINAVIHTHAPYATVFGMIDMEIPPIAVEAVFIKDYPKVLFFIPGSDDLTNAVLEKLAHSQVLGAFLQNHGLITLGKDLQSAAEKTMMVEHTLKILFALKNTGLEPSLISKKDVEFLSKLTNVI
ncbi:MAG TPA: class II aldolase/adducin family protein [Anaerolineae bacterium]|nr:class II aldolase/adducin family protein [Anaerolineae bacterium]